jgi:hypothetical protein
MVVYLGVGARLREFMPLFLYAFPVTAAAAALCALAAVAFEGAGAAPPLAADGLLGFAGSGARFGLTLGAGLVPGILGHTGANFALSAISPLVVSVFFLLDPVLGSLFGYALGFQLAPDGVVAACGAVLVLAAALVTLGDSGLPYSAMAWGALTCAGAGSSRLVDEEPGADAWPPSGGGGGTQRSPTSPGGGAPPLLQPPQPARLRDAMSLPRSAGGGGEAPKTTPAVP